MGKVISSVVVIKPDQIPKLESGPIQIILRPNLQIKERNKETEIEKK